MAEKKAFPLRLDPDLYEALKRWADAELRSVNAQIEYLLRESVETHGKGLKKSKARPKPPAG